MTGLGPFEFDGFPDSTLGRRSALLGNSGGIAGSNAVDCMVERGRRLTGTSTKALSSQLCAWAITA